MNEDINLYEILKGHENEIFYSPIFGYMTLISLKSNEFDFPLQFLPIDCNTRTINFPSNGKYWGNDYPNGECQIFPSKNQRDWNKWIEKHQFKTPKTWSELVKSDIGDIVGYNLECFYRERPQSLDYTPIEKSALALLKIHQLIEVSYGGNPSYVEKNKCHNNLYEIDINYENHFYVDREALATSHISFHTKEQAEEFLSYPENVQLLKDYFMIN